MRIKKPSPTLLISMLALVVAATGVAGALPGSNNVKTKNIAKGAVTTKKLRNNAVTAPKVADLVFKSPSFQNGWRASNVVEGGAGPPGFAKDAQGVVHLRGLVSQPSGAGGTIFTLPAGFRPAEFTGIATSCLTLGFFSATLLIQASGDVDVTVEPGGPNQDICESLGAASLDGVTFVAGG